MATDVAELEQETKEGFIRGLGLLDSTMIVAGSMIGSGIFIVSADIARQVGSPGWLMVVWLITGFLTIGAALSYGELAAMMPKAGGMYVYLKEAYAPFWGFLYGWTHFLVIGTATIAAVAGKRHGSALLFVGFGELFERGTHGLLLCCLRLHPIAHQLLFLAHVCHQALNAFGKMGQRSNGFLIGTAT